MSNLFALVVLLPVFGIVVWGTLRAVREWGAFSTASGTVLSLCVAALSCLGIYRILDGQLPGESPVLEFILLPYVALALLMAFILLLLLALRFFRRFEGTAQYWIERRPRATHRAKVERDGREDRRAQKRGHIKDR